MAKLSLSESIRSQILLIPGVSALISTRVYTDAAPQAPTFPYVIVQRTTSERHRALNNRSMKSAQSIYSVTIWAASRASANAIAELIAGTTGDSGLDGFSGNMPSSGGDPISVQSCIVSDVTDGHEYPQDAGESGYYSVSFDLKLFHNQ